MSIRSAALLALAVGALCIALGQSPQPAPPTPPHLAQSQRFLRQRGGAVSVRSHAAPPRSGEGLRATAQTAPQDTTSAPSWQPLGPAAVQTNGFGLVTGRIASLALDPADATGDTLYVGTTGGGLWRSQNAAGPLAQVAFHPLTDSVGTLFNGVFATSITIGAVSVQPGGTGVLLAGTGDINDSLDSYAGAGILRSADHGATWSLIPAAGGGLYQFFGEGFAGFAWSTSSPQTVVAAVSEAYRGTAEDMPLAGSSYQGLYYSSDAGSTWLAATVVDPNGTHLQDNTSGFANGTGYAVTAVVWSPIRHIFIAAIRYHGYYQSSDGINWSRMAAQPGSGLGTTACPTSVGTAGSVTCPIFRGALAVNPVTGDTFAWTIDAANQDQGIWQDACAINAGVCGNPTSAFNTQIGTAALEVNQPPLGAATISSGDYNLTLAAIPSGQDTLLFAGATDVWKCSLAMGCQWRNTTNTATCRSAAVGAYQHVIEWNPADPLQTFFGNDSGLWRSQDAVAETGSVCDAGDSAHFDNLNASLGSLSEVASMANVVATPYTVLAGLGVNGTAGVKSTSSPVANWPQVLDGEGGPVAIDPTSPSKWYVNNQAGVSIHLCSQSGDCAPADFGATPVVGEADVANDGIAMTAPAPFILDPLDPTELIVGTCRVWRGPTDGSAWSTANALSGFLDGVTTGSSFCNGNAAISAMAAAPLAGGSEVIYAGIAGWLDGGGTIAGHLFRATYTPGGSTPTWQDLALNPVTNDPPNNAFNVGQMRISSIAIDPHDASGNTVYVTVQGVRTLTSVVRTVYRSLDGGAHWAFASLGLPSTAANSIAVDPVDANTVYLATDIGVFATRQIASCSQPNSACWAAYGAGLPPAPVNALSVTPVSVTPSVLVAGTYGRGVWQAPLASAGTQLTTATVAPSSLDFGQVAFGAPSSAQSVTVTNTGGVALTVSSIAATTDFSETDDCQSGPLNTGATCTVQVSYTPSQAGARTGQLTINGNLSTASLTVALHGSGGQPGAITLLPTTLDFGSVQVGVTSSARTLTVANQQSAATAIGTPQVTGPFALAGNSCGSLLAGDTSCELTLTFAPTQSGSTGGTLTVTDSTGTHTAMLSGIGLPSATDTLAPTSLTFLATIIGQTAATQAVTLTNTGGVALPSITYSVTGPFTLSSTCGGQLAANSSCAFTVGFAPTVAGSASGTLTVTDSQRTQTVALSGTGVQPPVIGVNPASLSFTSQSVGVASAPLTLTVTNTGGAPMTGPGFAFTGSQAASFSVAANTCTATLAVNASCALGVVFNPAMAGSNTATLTLTSSTAGVQAVALSVSGTATAASGINVSPAQMSFTVSALGQSSPAQTATISNTSAAAATGLAVSTAPPFSANSTCSTTLAAGASCTVGVVFTPSANGSVAGALTIATANLNGASVLLTGAGGAAGSVTLRPSSLAFPVTAVGGTSAAQTVTLTNTSLVSLDSLGLSASSGFTLQSTTCGASLATGASCTASVVFTPTSTGSASGNLAVASTSLPGGGAQAALSGTGFDFSLGTGAASQSVASGQTASFSLTLTPLGGSSAAFSYSCGTLPAHSACSFLPPSLNVSANTSGNVTVNIATGAASAAARQEPANWGRPLALAGLLLLPLAWSRRRGGWLLVALLVVFAGGVTGCVASGGGSSGGGGGKGSNTPPGTYTIQVNVAANGITHAATFTLTVD